jgi:hypothetical protein
MQHEFTEHFNFIKLTYKGVEYDAKEIVSNEFFRNEYRSAVLVYHGFIEHINDTEGAYLHLTPDEIPPYKVVGKFHPILVALLDRKVLPCVVLTE